MSHPQCAEYVNRLSAYLAFALAATFSIMILHSWNNLLCLALVLQFQFFFPVAGMPVLGLVVCIMGASTNVPDYVANRGN